MAEKACHGFGSTTQVGLTQALGGFGQIAMHSDKDKWARRGVYSLITGAVAFFAYFNSKHQWVVPPEYNRFKGFWLEPFLPALEPYLPSMVLVIGTGFAVSAAYCFRRYATGARAPRPWLIGGSLLSGLASAYCFLWIFSAASLASGFCGNDFSLFAEHLRCRQVHFAMVLTVLFALLCVYLGWRAARAVRRPAA